MGVPERQRRVYLFAGRPEESQLDEVVAMDFHCVTTDCAEIPRPPDPRPVCCFSAFCLPFFPSPLAADGCAIGHSLPILALGRYEFGGVALLGSIDLLLRCAADCEAHMIFVENLLRWSASRTASASASPLRRDRKSVV
jgi:hypothetical protein